MGWGLIGQRVASSKLTIVTVLQVSLYRLNTNNSTGSTQKDRKSSMTEKLLTGT